jgi:predicted O-methyltransferase YrrM
MLDILLYIVYALLAVLLIAGARKFVRHKSLYPLLPYKYNFRKRRNTLRATIRLLEKRGAKVLVETGTARGGLARTKAEGASTVVFGIWAKKHGARLHSVDIDAASIEGARSAVTEVQVDDVVHFHLSDSVAFLAGFADSVDFLYLDSYDYHHDPAIQRASQEHHLREFEAIEGRLHDKSVVLIDDCNLEGGGKGKLVIERMLQSGWKTVLDEYQVLLVRA